MKQESPWLCTPGVDSVYPTLDRSLDTDIVVVGGGIAGCMTAYFLLRHTKQNIVLLEGNRITRGATGHNAGQIDVFFETPVGELVTQYGIDLTKNGYQAMFDARVMLEEVIDHIQRQGQYSKYIGYNVYTTKEQLFEVCEQLRLFDELGLEINELFVCEGKIANEEIPEQYTQYINRISHGAGEEYIGSKSLEWLCFEATHYATINSAALCHSIVEYLLSTYQDRFSLYEKTLVSEVKSAENITLITSQGDITCKEIVLCTNAYHAYTINGESDILHIDSITGCMAGYYIPHAKVPTTIGYQPPTNSYTDGYYYHSVRHFHDREHTEHTLVTLGGPDVEKISDEYPQEYKKDLDSYIKNFYTHDQDGSYYRSGEMGYTDTGLRKIGPHKNYSHIRYNIGCNGVGILGSIHGGRKIAQYFQGLVSEKSIFDV